MLSHREVERLDEVVGEGGLDGDLRTADSDEDLTLLERVGEKRVGLDLAVPSTGEDGVGLLRDSVTRYTDPRYNSTSSSTSTRPETPKERAARKKPRPTL